MGDPIGLLPEFLLRTDVVQIRLEGEGMKDWLTRCVLE